jgi:predicted PhzF superfamily epimerase YddE/YHI9/ribosomal protein S18 acetylase RimI-like enzyme
MSILEQIHFRTVSPTDIPACFEIEVASYPPDEAASKSALQYRQHHAARYFRCAVLGDDDSHHVVGYICSTRCHEFSEESMSVHDFSGPLLAIHSVVVQEEYRHYGIAHAMLKDYIKAMQDMDDGVEKLVLLSKSHLLGFYVQCGFTVVKPSTIVHGQDAWFDCELVLEKRYPESYSCWILDSFALKAASGNPAAVVLLPAGTDIDNEDTIAWMQVVAKEFNLSETAFLWPLEDDDDDDKTEEQPLKTEPKDKRSDDDVDTSLSSLEPVKNVKYAYNIRYFTCNGTQVDLCGHATLASAAVLFQTLAIKNSESAVEFHANKNVLQAMPMGSSSHNSMQVKMNLPKKQVTPLDDIAKLAVLSMLKAAFSHLDDDILEQAVLYVGLDEDGGDLLVEMTRDAFIKLGYKDISYSAFLEWDGYSRGVILCCQEEAPQNGAKEQDDVHDDDDDDDESIDEVVDFLSRFFGPKAGINEDPVTGSAHCTLAPYFCTKLNKSTLVGKQLSERGGIVTCIVEEERVSIIGTAITTVRGSLSI